MEQGRWRVQGQPQPQTLGTSLGMVMGQGCAGLWAHGGPASGEAMAGSWGARDHPCCGVTGAGADGPSRLTCLWALVRVEGALRGWNGALGHGQGRVLGRLSRDSQGWWCLVALSVLFSLSDKEESMKLAEPDISREVFTMKLQMRGAKSNAFL